MSPYISPDMVHDVITTSVRTKESLLARQYLQDISNIGYVLVGAYASQRKMLIAGNGGSAADAQHFAAEITCQFSSSRKRRGFPAIALHTDSSALTAWGNDIGFDTVFSRQLEAHGVEGDVLVLISTSGNSRNLIHAARKAKELGVVVVGILGRDGGELYQQGLCDHVVIVPSTDTPRIQECHITIIHILCEALDQFFVDFSASSCRDQTSP